MFFISTHQSPLYPGTGSLDEVGQEQGKGYTVNIPLPPGTGDSGFHAVMDEIILPLAERYGPEIILVSIGFDPHWRDPLGHLFLSADQFGFLISKLNQWADAYCQGRFALFLEGGYDLEAGKACLQAAVAAMLGYEWRDWLGPSPKSEGTSWRQTISRAKSIWKL